LFLSDRQPAGQTTRLIIKQLVKGNKTMLKQDTNSVILTGNLVQNPEVVEKGKFKMAKMILAVNGKEEEDVMFVKIAAQDKLADFVAQNLSKGNGVVVMGKLSQLNEKKNLGVVGRLVFPVRKIQRKRAFSQEPQKRSFQSSY